MYVFIHIYLYAQCIMYNDHKNCDSQINTYFPFTYINNGYFLIRAKDDSVK